MFYINGSIYKKSHADGTHLHVRKTVFFLSKTLISIVALVRLLVNKAVLDMVSDGYSITIY